MATKTQATPSSSSRVRFGFGHKHSRTRLPPPEPPEHAGDEDWYIPYNGPYELPPAAPPSQNRDSWGQLLGSVLGNLGSAKSSDVGHAWSDGRMASGHRHPASALPSSGAYSSHPYRMYAAPNAAGAPGPVATGSQGRGAVSQPLRGGRSTLTTSAPTAFANVDNTGGVGESPTPVQRSSPPYASPPSSALNRLSLGSFLTFGGSSRKSRSDSVPSARRPSARRSRNITPTPDPLQSNRAMALDAQPSRSHSPLSLGQAVEHRPRQRSHTLMGITSSSPAKPSSPSHDSSVNSYYTRESSLSTHPYAHTFPSSRTEAPRRAPIVPPSAYHSSGKGKGIDRSYRYPRPPAPDTLNKTEIPAHLKPASRTSLFKTISAPNLRNLPRGISANQSTSSRGKSRWLSPETWCDALLFPRPRFMEYIDDEPPQSSRHRHTTLTRSSEVHSTREQPKYPQTALRVSHSATNLHAPISEASRGPPRAEPMLMPRGESSNADGQSSPARPRSFAQDDLALPSPVPSLARVLEMGASFERERATWKAYAARSLQSSKLTRSLGRSRSQSVGRARAQLKEVGGVGFLATKTLLGNQFAAPIIHTRTPSEGTQTQQTQSRSGGSHARTMSSSGLSRAGSRGKAALRAATGLCVSGDKMSPRDERFEAVSRNDGRAKDAHIEVIPRKPDAGPSPSPPVTSPSDVGLALCSPPPSMEGDVDEPPRPTYAQVHPFAQSSQSPSRRSHARSSSDYAGPHPSAVSIAAPTAALASDMSARHRLPPHAALHPYASALACSSAASPQHPTTVLPALSSESHQSPRSLPVPPNRRPQLSGTRETPRGPRHAYALSNYLGGEPLAFVDALLSGPQRRLSADSGLGDSEQHSEAPASAVPLFPPLPDFVLTTPSEQQRLDLARSSTFLSLNSTIVSSPPETLNPPVFTASMLSYSLHSAQASLSDEPVQGSSASSPHQSPQPFGTIEDLERYRNLFYRPRASGSSRTPSSEHRRMLSRDTGSLMGVDTSSNSRVSGGSGLTVLTRQLSNELEAIQDICRLDVTGSSHGNPPHMWGLRYGGLRGDDGMGSRTDPNAVLSIASESDMSSPDAAMLPLSLHQNLGHQSLGSLTVHIPQDVASQTSSVLDRSMEDIDHDELLRMGTVEAVSTPPATVPTHRLSFAGDVHRVPSSQESLRSFAPDDEEHPLLPPMLVTSDLRHGSRTSLLPAGFPSATTDVTRSSYQTDGTGTSYISGLSDFPAPPTQTVVSSDRVEHLKSYFGGDAQSRPVSQSDDPPKAEPAPVPSSLSSSSSSRLQRPALGRPSRVSHERSRGGADAH